MGISVQESCARQSNLISNQRLITTTTNYRQLVSELMFQPNKLFFEHNHSLPKNFLKLATHLNKMSKEGVICE